MGKAVVIIYNAMVLIQRERERERERDVERYLMLSDHIDKFQIALFQYLKLMAIKIPPSQGSLPVKQTLVIS